MKTLAQRVSVGWFQIFFSFPYDYSIVKCFPMNKNDDWMEGMDSSKETSALNHLSNNSCEKMMYRTNWKKRRDISSYQPSECDECQECNRVLPFCLHRHASKITVPKNQPKLKTSIVHRAHIMCVMCDVCLNLCIRSQLIFRRLHMVNERFAPKRWKTETNLNKSFHIIFFL